MVAKLVSEEGANKGLVLSFEEGDEWVIGRDPDLCQLTVEDPSTSRRHLVARQSKEGLVVENLSNTNPIQINGMEVHGPQLLQAGDTVKIGSGLFRFYLETEAHLLGNGKPKVGEEAPYDTIFGEEETSGAEHGLAEVNFDLTTTGRWLLKVISGPNNGAEFSMEKGHSYMVGTDAASCDVVFHDLSVSRQHARLTVGDDESLSIEDLGSRNGTQVEGEPVKGKQKLNGNALVTLGTTSFVTIDRQQEQSTIVPPPLATLGRVVKNEEAIQAVQAAVQNVPHTPEPEEEEEKPPRKEEKKTEEPQPSPHELHHHRGTRIIILTLAAVLCLGGYGLYLLFQPHDIVTEKVDLQAQLAQTFQSHPQLRYTFSQPTGRLMILGHVLTSSDRNQLLYNLKALPMITKIDDNIIIDELVWQEINQVLSKNPAWRAVTVTSPEPGHFVLNGYLKTRAEANALSDYIGLNFPYPELLEKKIVVEEDVTNQVTQSLGEKGINTVTLQMNNGEVTLTGSVPFGKKADVDNVVTLIKNLNGVRTVKNFVVEQEPEESMINLSSQYEVTGHSNILGKNVSVVINGRILTVGDTLDGMKIVGIRPGTIFLEKDGFKYRIDYNK